MSNIQIFNHSIHDIGYISRTVTYGEEYEMVLDFIDCYLKSRKNLKNKQIAIFIEPQIDTGYPDIVIVDYYITKGLSWVNTRYKLTNNDLKILFEIQKNRSISINKLKSSLGFSENELEKIITNLANCKLIYKYADSGSVRNVRLKSYCIIKNVIAIEAKIDKWNEAIRQATNNTWFATESYILMKKDKCNDAIMKTCEERGIGIYLTNGKNKKVLGSNRKTIPVSYSTLQFNEWILRRHFKEVNNDYE